MKEWPTVKLGDVADQCLGKMLDAKKNKGSLMPYLRNPNVRWFDVNTSDLQLMPFEAHEHERYGLKAGDIVICEGGDAGRAAIWDGRLPDLKFQKAIHRVRPGPELHNRYFVHQLMMDHQNGLLGDYLTGATIKHFTGRDLNRYKFPLPPLAEQKRIAAILDAADALRTKRREALAQLDALLQSTFLTLFGDAVSNPMGWERKTLGEIINFVGGSQPPKETFTYEPGPGKIRLVQIRDFKSDRFQTYIPEKLARRPFNEDDVMIARYGPPVFQILRGLSGSYNVALMKADPIGAVEKLFIFHLLSQPKIVAAVVAKSERTAGQTGVNLQFLNSYPADLPPLPLQQKFAAIVESIERQKTTQRAHLAELDALFAALQHRAFRGEL